MYKHIIKVLNFATFQQPYIASLVYKVSNNFSVSSTHISSYKQKLCTF